MIMRRRPVISIHAPHTGSDLTLSAGLMIERLFQSTLPIRGATDKVIPCSHDNLYFNPRSPYGERQSCI